jgi:tetratricopeptide (TPR) repeat protein
MIELSPSNLDPYKRRAECHFHLENYPLVVADLIKAVELTPPDFSDLTWLKSGGARPRDALIESAGKMIQAMPESPQAYIVRARIYRDCGEGEKAKVDMEKAVALAERLVREHPNDSKGQLRFCSCLIALGRLYNELGRRGEAETVYQRAIALVEQIGPENPDQLAEMLIGQARQAVAPATVLPEIAKQSLVLAKRAVQLNPAAENAWNTIGMAHYRAGDWTATVAALEKSMQLRNGVPSLDLVLLAMARWKLGNYDEACKWYDKASQWIEKNQPMNEDVRRFRKEAEALLKVSEKMN